MPEQLVKVRFDTGPQLYTYKWSFSLDRPQYMGYRTPLKVGDRVITPPNWRNPNEGEATVVELGSDWPGSPIAELRGRVPNDDEDEVH
jgi:hypothetical protein